jgi:hypothetical protein
MSAPLFEPIFARFHLIHRIASGSPFDLGILPNQLCVQVFGSKPDSATLSCSRTPFHSSAAQNSQLKALSIRSIAAKSIVFALAEQGHHNPVTLRPLKSPVEEHGEHVKIFVEGLPFCLSARSHGRIERDNEIIIAYPRDKLRQASAMANAFPASAEQTRSRQQQLTTAILTDLPSPEAHSRARPGA